MKKIHSMLIALPIILAVLASCSDDLVAQQPEQATSKSVTFMAGIGLKTTRVDYVPTYNNGIPDEVKCDWAKSDEGKLVTLKDSRTGEVYEFEIESVNEEDKTARIVYPQAKQDAKPFPSNFKGTATYVVGTGIQEQGVNNPSTAAECAYLGNGVEIEADIPLIEATVKDGVYEYPEKPYKITFRHKNTCIFRVKFKAPANLPANTTLRIYANGIEELGEVKLGFAPLTQETEYIAYVRCKASIEPELSQQVPMTKHDTPTPVEMLTFVLDPHDNTGKSHVCRKFYPSLETAGLQAGKYYYTDISGYAASQTSTFSVGTTNRFYLDGTKVDFITGEPKIWTEQDTYVANFIGFAPLYETYIQSSTYYAKNINYFHIPLDADHKLASDDASASYYLYVAHDLLRAKTNNHKIQNQTQESIQQSGINVTSSVLYFYYGDVDGATADYATSLVNPQDLFYNIDGDQKQGKAEEPKTYKYSYKEPYIEGDTYYDFAYKYGEDFVPPYLGQTYYYDQYNNVVGKIWKHMGCDHRDLVLDCFSIEEPFQSMANYRAFVMKPWVDAASHQWRGGWRCMGYNEVNAFIDATDRNPSAATSVNSTETPASISNYVFSCKNKTSNKITLPSTGDLVGDYSGSTGAYTHTNKRINRSNLVFWLRSAIPQEVSSGVETPKYLDKAIPYSTSRASGAHVQIGVNSEDFCEITDGLPILPALVVNKATGKPDIYRYEDM